MTAEKFKEIACRYLAEGYLEQMLDPVAPSVFSLKEHNGTLYQRIPETGPLETYQYRLIRLVHVEDGRAVLSMRDALFEEYTGTIEMTKTTDGWIATGGDFFETCLWLNTPDSPLPPENQDPPQTGDATPYLACLVTLSVFGCVGLGVLAVKRKRKVV
jgi:hypothetical protein